MIGSEQFLYHSNPLIERIRMVKKLFKSNHGVTIYFHLFPIRHITPTYNIHVDSNLNITRQVWTYNLVRGQYANDFVRLMLLQHLKQNNIYRQIFTRHVILIFYT